MKTETQIREKLKELDKQLNPKKDTNNRDNLEVYWKMKTLFWVLDEK